MADVDLRFLSRLQIGLARLGNDAAGNNLSVDHRDLAGDIQPAVRLDCTREWQMLTSGSFPAFRSDWRDWVMMPPGTISPLTIATWPETYSQPSASTARANGRC